MNWTTSQRKAIEARNKTLLISAGAGSGKTTVLTRRLTERIIAGDSVEDFLVVTFTKAAAGDLKEKLYDALTDAMASQPQNRHLFNQLFLLAGARISTIHSFCFDTVKKSFALLGLSPKVRIADDTEAVIIARGCLEELVDRLYEEDNQRFLLLVNSFGGEKSDAILLDRLLALYNKLRSFHNYSSWLKDKQAELQEQAELIEANIFDTEIGKRIKEKVILWLEEAKAATEELQLYLAHTVEGDANIKPIDELGTHINGLIAAAKNGYNSLYTSINTKTNGFRLNYRGMSSDDTIYLQESKNNITGEINRIRKSFCYLTDRQIYEDYLITADIAAALGEVLELFDAAYSKAKKKRGILDFADLEHYTAKLLEEKDGNGIWRPTELCLRLRESIKEIYIDEYQDVNPLQDHIFTLLSKSKNRFMVGDVKQSIYRFRNAYPDIFVAYKNNYPDYDADDSDNGRIFLKENFRCAKPIIDFVNSVFAAVTTGNRFEAEYKGEELVYAKNSNAECYPVLVALSLYDDKDKESKASAREREAEYVAAEIERLVGKEKREDGSLIRFGDIALLFSAVRGRAKLFEQALTKRGIPCRTEQDESLFGMPEIMLVLSALKAVDNPTDDISLCALLRSPLFGFTTDELYKIRIATPGHTMFYSLTAAAQLNSYRRCRSKNNKYRITDKRINEPISIIKKCHKFIQELDFYRARAQGMLCYKFLWLFYIRSGLLSAAAGYENGDKCRENLLLLYQYARSFENTGFKGLSSFILYTEEIAERGGDLARAKASEPDGNYVHIMSIHKAKGLEFPVCFVLDTAKTVDERDKGGDIILSRELGIFCRIKDADKCTKRDTYLRRMAAIADKDASMGEELRKLYVALTRARERLYVTACVPDNYDDKAKKYNPLSANSFAYWILHTVTSMQTAHTDVYIIPEDIGLQSNYAFHNAPASLPAWDGGEIEPEEEKRIINAVEYVYPYIGTIGVPAKLSVSELSLSGEKNTFINRKMILIRPEFMSKTDFFGAEKGTANHLFMQFANFAFLEQNGVEREALRLLETRMLTREQYDLLSFGHIKAFFVSSLYTEMKAAKKLYREKRFSLSESAELAGGPKEERILIQGVIDCFFENKGGGYTLVDYKTDFLPEERGEQILIERHKKQVDYYCKAVAAMTGKRVTRAVLYSFSLDKSVEVEQP